MAIKGKKKSQSRGSQARRRPAMAPRPVPGRAGRKPPWYKTTAGQSLAGIATLILIVIVLVLVNNSRNAAAEREQAQESLENYTDQVSALLQRITPPASEMSAAATAAPPEDLKDNAEEWSNNFTAAQSEVSQFVAPPEASTSRDLFLEAMRLFAAAGDTMQVAADLEGQAQTRLMTTAGGQVTSASGVWDAAVAILDEARDDADLSASGIRPPTMAPGSAAATPAPAATIPIESDEGSGQGGGGKGGKGKKGDGGDG